MQTLIFLLLLSIMAGVAVGLQGPLATIIGQRLGLLESVFIIHLGGTMVALIPLLFLGGGNLSQWHRLPWYTLPAGAFGLVVISVLSYSMPRIGVAPTMVAMLAGQLAIGLVLDQYGLLGEVRPFDLGRAIGLVAVFVGLWLLVR